MKRVLIACVALFLLGGCAQKELRIFDEDRPYAQALRWTKKGDIAISLENKALIIATYLNPLQKRWDREYFFVRVYIDNDFDDPKKAGLYHPGYYLRLGNHDPEKIEEVDFESLLAKRMPFVQKWYRLYLVTFAPQQKRELSLIFGNKDYGEVVLTFQKPE